MCGIFAILNYDGDMSAIRSEAVALSKLNRHRGPDWSGCMIRSNNILCHERLAIVGLDTGSQPLTNEDDSIVVDVNGEIYNFQELKKELEKKYKFKTHSDCEVIVYLFAEKGVEFLTDLRGQFSFVAYDGNTNRSIIARDRIGITTLYYGYRESHPECLFVSSEMKALIKDCDHIRAFPPGHYYDSKLGKFERYYNPIWFDNSYLPKAPVDLNALRTSLELSVRRRLMSEVPFGVLLSGGLDSSLIASIATREIKKALNNQDLNGIHSGFSFSRNLHSFSIGLPGSPDLKAARDVANYIGTKHYEFNFTLQEGHDALMDVIYHLETYDVTTVRASTPMYLLSRKIKALGVKMVLSGEGSDEIFGGYLYFHKAPDATSFHQETVARVKNLHLADCLRANKSTMAWGLEARVPFLDADFLDVAMTIDPKEKMITPGRMEKYILRKAFDCKEQPYLPDSVLWRQKEQFSDGIGYSWIDSLKEKAEENVTDEMFSNRAITYPKDTPATKEAFWYRTMFEKFFGKNNAAESTVELWVPRADWGCPTDPSGRAQQIHVAAL